MTCILAVFAASCGVHDGTENSSPDSSSDHPYTNDPDEAALLREDCDPAEQMEQPLIDRLQEIDGDVRVYVGASFVDPPRRGVDQRPFNEEVAERLEEPLTNHGFEVEARLLNHGALQMWGPASEIPFVACLEEIEQVSFYEDEELDCPSRNEDECNATEHCSPIYGSRVDDSGECMVSEVLGCQRVTAACGYSQTTSISPDGVCYEFPSTCVPQGWDGGGSWECDDPPLPECDD